MGSPGHRNTDPANADGAGAGAFIAGGFSVDLTHHMVHALGNRIFGFSPEAFDDPTAAPPLPADPDEQEAMLRRARHLVIACLRRETAAICNPPVLEPHEP